jgi:hypothetical protein
LTCPDLADATEKRRVVPRYEVPDLRMRPGFGAQRSADAAADATRGVKQPVGRDENGSADKGG